MCLMLLSRDLWDGEPMGWCEVDCSKVLEGEKVDDWFDLHMGPEGEEVQGAVRIGLEYFPKGALEVDTSRVRKFSGSRKLTHP